jgi:quercetin dioxygenase-like cupin family protein
VTEQEAHAYLKSHQISGDKLQLDLEDERRAVLEAARSAGMGHSAKTLVKDGPLRVVLIGLVRGSQLREHKAEGPVVIQSIQGEAQVTTADATDRLAPGSLLVFGPGIAHSVEATDDCVLTLTIAAQASS